MSVTRNNHYVPRWHQEGFFEPGQNTLAYLDLTPPHRVLESGRTVFEKSRFNAPTSRAFVQRDLYSTFFGTQVNDEIERRLFGDIDTRGADAVRAFCGKDPVEWQRHFVTLFEYLDIQKVRTPKGLAWLSRQYPRLTQNELMFEMQGIRMMHCTIWAEGVREIVSAEEAATKFIVTDHPVTIYNHAMPPGGLDTEFPHDPSIALKASQTLFPLNRDFCLILTNLEYAEDPAQPPRDKRTFAGNYRNSMVRTDAFIRTRKLSDAEVIRINRVLKERAHRYIAAGKPEWLYPERGSAEPWAEIRTTLLPPKNGRWLFGGEMYASFESGEVYYQDAFGRTEKPRDFLQKQVPDKPLRPKDPCGCGSGRLFGTCCQAKAPQLRPTWTEMSIRERNLILARGLSKMLGLDDGKDWIEARRSLTDATIKQAYELYDALWPLQTRLLDLLPKPDGVARAVYTGLIHPTTLAEFAFGTSLYFDELLIQHPFVHPRTMKKEFSPSEHPSQYRQEFLKSAILVLTAAPLIERGIINLVPDPCDFDFHLRDMMLAMAKSRLANVRPDPRNDPRVEQIAKDDSKRAMMLMPKEALRKQLRELNPELDEATVEATMRFAERQMELDPLAVLQPESLGAEGQLLPMKLAPNFELTMFLAQATGSMVVTDSVFRWNELKRAVRPSFGQPQPLLDMCRRARANNLPFLLDAAQIAAVSDARLQAAFPALYRKILRYLTKTARDELKPNVEAGLSSEFGRARREAEDFVRKTGVLVTRGQIELLCFRGGIENTAANRLLLMSSSEHHLASVPLAMFIQPEAPDTPLNAA